MSHHLPEPAARPAQVAYPNRAMVRTGVQSMVGLAAIMPFIVSDLGIGGSGAVVVGVLGVSAAVTRIMAIPAVNVLLGRYLDLGATPLHSRWTP